MYRWRWRKSLFRSRGRPLLTRRRAFSSPGTRRQDRSRRRLRHPGSRGFRLSRAPPSPAPWQTRNRVRLARWPGNPYRPTSRKSRAGSMGRRRPERPDGESDGREAVEPPRGMVLALRADRRLRPERSEVAGGNSAGGIGSSSPERIRGDRAPGTNRNSQPAVAELGREGEHGDLRYTAIGRGHGGACRDNSAGSGHTEGPARARRRRRAGGTRRSSGGPDTRRDTQDLPTEARARPLDPGAANRRERRQRAGRRARARLADPPPGRRRPLGRAGSRGTTDGTPVKGDDDFTVHCPPGETCFGECAYWEADTALTGLALLTYLGAGYTHTDGRYAEVVGKGLDFLIEPAKARRRSPRPQPGRRHVLSCDGHAGAVRGLCPHR